MSAEKSEKFNPDSQMDSGFLSGENLMSSQSLSGEFDEDPEITESGMDLSEKVKAMDINSEEKPKVSKLGISESHIAILKEIFVKDDDGDK